MRLLLLIFLFLFSCGTKDDALDENVDNVDISALASRTYSPSTWSHLDMVSLQAGDFELSSEIMVLAGNAGTGWASIVINNIRYCFQGNAGNNNQLGDRFELKYQKTNLSEQCYQGSNSPAVVDITLAIGTSIKMEIHGGGCGSICSDTTGQMTLFAK
jgi:hypothetical protein